MEQKDILNLISNEQRKFFGLQEIDPNWKQLDVVSPNFQNYSVTIFIDGQIVRKCIVYGERKYEERELYETLSKNFDLILPKDEKKKPSTIDSIVNKSGVGVSLSFDAPNIKIINEPSRKTFYTNYFSKSEQPQNIDEFKQWVTLWCDDSTQNDLEEIEKFAKNITFPNISYKEGDIFRVKLTRRLYGYGRILLDYKKMKENGEKFWDCFMETPIVVSLYRILTENKNLTERDLENLPSFPSEIIIDNNIRSGSYKIIGNKKVDYETEDYPIMYGSDLGSHKKVYFQRGKQFLELENSAPISFNFRNNGVSLNIGFDIELMKKCIEENSNLPYFENGPFKTKTDLRNPLNSTILTEILHQFNIENLQI